MEYPIVLKVIVQEFDRLGCGWAGYIVRYVEFHNLILRQAELNLFYIVDGNLLRVNLTVKIGLDEYWVKQ